MRMAGTSFLEIYTRAITEFQDPQLKALYSKNIVLFTQVMNNFMTNAISLFTNPLPVRIRLSKVSQPYEYTENFVGDGITTEYPIKADLSMYNTDELLFSANVNGSTTAIEYSKESNSVIFFTPPEINSVIVITAYFPGSFDVALYEEEKYILSQWVMVCWAEYVENNKLDIDRLLGDTDFSLTSNSTTTQAKTSWYVVNRETASKRMNKYAWDSAILGTYK